MKNILTGGLAGLVLACTLAGCSPNTKHNGEIFETKEQYTSRIMSQTELPGFNPYFKPHLEEAVRFFDSINPQNMTQEQKEAIKEYNEHPEKYRKIAEFYTWLGATARDKIYMVQVDEAGRAAARAFSESIPSAK